MIDLDKLRSFYYVIKEGSLQKAAAALNKNHTTLSKHLTELEESNKVKLFVRKRKRLELTDKGKDLFGLAQATLPNIENGMAEILSSTTQTNSLKVITTTGVNGLWVVRSAKKLQEEFPDLQVSIITTTSEIDFEGSKADVGILPKQQGQGLTQKKVRTIHMALYASPEYVEKHGVPKDLDDLENHKLISFYSGVESNLGNVDWHLTRGLPSGFRQSHLTINTAFLGYEAVCQGLGIISLIKEFEYLEEGNLVHILPEVEGPSFDIFFVTRADTILTPVQKRFLEIIQNG